MQDKKIKDFEELFRNVKEFRKKEDEALQAGRKVICDYTPSRDKEDMGDNLITGEFIAGFLIGYIEEQNAGYSGWGLEALKHTLEKTSFLWFKRFVPMIFDIHKKLVEEKRTIDNQFCWNDYDNFIWYEKIKVQPEYHNRIAYVHDSQGRYDVIIVDSPNHLSPGNDLPSVYFREAFNRTTKKYGHIKKKSLKYFRDHNFDPKETESWENDSFDFNDFGEKIEGSMGRLQMIDSVCQWTIKNPHEVFVVDNIKSM